MQKAAVAGREIRGYTRRQDGFHDILAFAFFRRSREGGVSEQRLVKLAAALCVLTISEIVLKLLQMRVSDKG